uniref:60S ribosomal protein L15 isoform X1 n=1 Tax=Rhizophora mucronata TaxID=61149 RepID=A0A2P2LD62_RHIMU
MNIFFCFAMKHSQCSIFRCMLFLRFWSNRDIANAF